MIGELRLGSGSSDLDLNGTWVRGAGRRRGSSLGAEVRFSVSRGRRIAKILALQKQRDLTEGRSLGFVPAPTLQHQVVDVLRGCAWFWQVFEAQADLKWFGLNRVLWGDNIIMMGMKLLYLLVLVVFLFFAALELWGLVAVGTVAAESTKTADDLVVAEVLVGYAPSEIQDLPERHGEWPDVAFRRVFTLRKKILLLG